MTTALVLGGGGARGIAHIGALKALEQKGIMPDLIVGTSAGAIMGALYAYYQSADKLEAIVLETTKKTLLNKRINFLRGLSDGKGLRQFISEKTQSSQFSDLALPFYSVCLNLATGEKVVINEGCVARAVQASCALPPIFQPVRYGDQLLVDGGAVAPVAVDSAKALGADHVIAVNVGIELPEREPKTALGILTRYNLMRNRELDRRTAASADVVIRPDLPGANILDDSNRELLIQKGFEAASKAL